MKKKMRLFSTACAFTMVMISFAAGCNDDGQAGCTDYCNKVDECFGAGECNCDASGDESGEQCANDAAILDHLEGCLSQSCDDMVDCMAAAPPCEL